MISVYTRLFLTLNKSNRMIYVYCLVIHSSHLSFMLSYFKHYFLNFTLWRVQEIQFLRCFFVFNYFCSFVISNFKWNVLFKFIVFNFLMKQYCNCHVCVISCLGPFFMSCVHLSPHPPICASASQNELPNICC